MRPKYHYKIEFDSEILERAADPPNTVHNYKREVTENAPETLRFANKDGAIEIRPWVNMDGGRRVTVEVAPYGGQIAQRSMDPAAVRQLRAALDQFVEWLDEK